MHRKGEGYDGVKRQLRALNIAYGIAFPANLRLTYNGQSHELESLSQAKQLICDIQCEFSS